MLYQVLRYYVEVFFVVEEKFFDKRIYLCYAFKFELMLVESRYYFEHFFFHGSLVAHFNG